MKSLKELQKVSESKEHNPQVLRDFYAEHQFSCCNCLYGTTVYRNLNPIFCKVKREFISKANSFGKCDKYLPDATVDRALRKIMIIQSYKKLHTLKIHLKKGDKDARSRDKT